MREQLISPATRVSVLMVDAIMKSSSVFVGGPSEYHDMNMNEICPASASAATTNVTV